MRKPILLFVLLCILFVRCRSIESNYSMFHGDAGHTGVCPGSHAGYPDQLKWKFKTGGKVISSPLISGEIVYVGSEDSNLYAVNAMTGHLLWKFRTRGAVSSSPVIFGQAIYFTSYDGYCYAVNYKSGTEIWRFKTGGEKKVGARGLWTMKPDDLYMEDLWDFFLSSPVVDSSLNPILYFGSSDSNLYALNAKSGTLKWKFKTGGLIHTSPALYNQTVYFGSWDSFLYALDAQSGQQKWKFRTKDQPVYHVLEGIQASPAVKDNVVYMGGRDGFFYAINAQDGHMIWNFPADNSWVLTTAAVYDHVVYFGTSDTYLMMALEAETGRKKWSMKGKGYIYSSPVISGNNLYFGDFTGNLFSVDLDSEAKRFQTFSTDARTANSSRILNEKGELDFAFTAGTQDLAYYESSVDVMNEFFTLGSIISSPAISGDLIYFGSTDGNLYAVSLKAKR